MASPPKVRDELTLDEFLGLPEIDEPPYLEYIDGRIEEKVSPQKKHSFITKRIMERIDQHARPSRLGETFPKLRCTFAGRSIVPDAVFLLWEHIGDDERGEIANETF